MRSEPAAGALLDSPPDQVALEFSEDLDPAFSRVQLFDGKNQLVDPGPGTIDPGAPRVLRLPLVTLPKDSYTAVWRVRSAADGHITTGSVPFGVGVATTTTSLIPPLGAPDPATLPPPPLDTAVRWLSLLAAAAAFGGLPFALLVWRPAFRHWSLVPGPLSAATDDGPPTMDDLVAADEEMARALRRLLAIGCALFLAATLFFILTQAAAASEVPIEQALGAPLLQLLRGRSGLILMARIALTFQVAVLSWRLPPPGRDPARLWWIALVIGAVTLLAISMTSHAAAEPNALVTVPLDWLHIMAMVAWLGGLIPLAIAIRAARRRRAQALPLGLLIPRFSWLSASCLLALALTGLYSAFLHIGDPALLPATTYGRALVVKLGLFGVLLLLGGLNMFVLTPRLRASGSRLARAFGRSVWAELVAGALLLLAVGAMTSIAPSKAAWEAHEQQGIAQAATEGDVDLTLRIAPAQIGDNEIAVDVADRRPGASAAATRVLLRFDMLGMDMGKTQTEASPSGAERYTTRGGFLSMGGRWHIEVVLRRAGFDDVRHTFVVDIVRGPGFTIEGP